MTTSMDRRALPGLLSGLAGCGLGVIGAVLQSPTAAVLGALSALLAGGWSLALLDRARMAEQRAERALTELAVLRELEMSVVPSPSLVDPDTSLPDHRWFEVTVEHRVSAARRHLWPVTVVMLDLATDDGPGQRQQVVEFCALVGSTLREADAVCRLGPHTFALILEDTNEAGGVWAAERLQVAVARQQLAKGLAAGVATYPTHGMDHRELLARCRTALRRAASADAGFGLGHVEVATADPVGGA